MNFIKKLLSFFKRPKRKVIPRSSYVNKSEIEGYYLGCSQINDTSRIHMFLTKAGRVGVWGRFDMNRKLAASTIGTMTRITLVGTRKPGVSLQTYKVEQDSERTLTKRKAPKAIWNLKKEAIQMTEKL